MFRYKSILVCGSSIWASKILYTIPFPKCDSYDNYLELCKNIFPINEKINSAMKFSTIKYGMEELSDIQKYLDAKNVLNKMQANDKKTLIEIVKQCPLSIQCIDNPDVDVQMAAVNSYCGAIEYIDNPDLNVQISAVEKDGLLIAHIENPNVDVQMTAVKKNNNAIKYIKNPDAVVQMMVIINNPFLIVHIVNPDLNVKQIAHDKIRIKDIFQIIL